MGIWDNGFEEPSVNFPEKIVLERIESFEKATDGLASMKMEQLDDIEKIGSKLSCNFQYRVLLTSRHISGYSFEIMKFGYDVSIYPAFIIFEDEIGEELRMPKNNRNIRKIKFEDEESFTTLIDAIFKTQHFRKIVGGLMKIARSKRDDTEEPW